MSLLGFAVGLVGGFGAFVFRELIGLVHNLLFLQQFSFSYDANLFTPASPWGAFGSTLGQLLYLSAAQRITLIAAGAGAGIAATFNTRSAAFCSQSS
jgi:hypothetical protein